MKPFIAKRFEPVVFGFLLSGMMSFIVSGVSTFLALGAVVVSAWIKVWISSWAIAFPAVLIVAPMVRRILPRVIKPQ
jgi:hypothetical protein